ncbi:hypothetical protein FRC10_006622, partial [Ceratobasidium sp. 414]
MPKVYEIDDWTPEQIQILELFSSSLPLDDKDDVSDDAVNELTNRLFPEESHSAPKSEPALCRFSSDHR